MEQKFNTSLAKELKQLREFYLLQGEAIIYLKGNQLEREGDWLGGMLQVCKPWHQRFQITHYMVLLRG